MSNQISQGTNISTQLYNGNNTTEIYPIVRISDIQSNPINDKETSFYKTYVTFLKNANNSIYTDDTFISPDVSCAHAVGKDNEIYSKYAHAEGFNNKVGLKGYSFKTQVGDKYKGNYTKNGLNINITLDTQANYAINDILSVCMGSKYENSLKINSITGNTLTCSLVDSNIDPFTEDLEIEEGKEGIDDFTIWCHKKPNIGNIDLGWSSHVEGENNIATNRSAHAEGRDTSAYGQYSHAEGRETGAGYAAHAEGRGTKAYGEQSHAEGNKTQAKGKDSHAEGKETTASGIQSHAEGQWTNAEGSQAHAEGESTNAVGNHSHAEGYSTLSKGANSHAEGESTQALGTDSHAEGFQTTAKGNFTHAEGYNAIAYGNYSHAEGYSALPLAEVDKLDGDDYEKKWGNAVNTSKFNMAFGNQSHVEGNSNIAIGKRAHVEGIFNKGYGENSHTEGRENKSLGAQSHAEGYQTDASGANSHAEGFSCQAIGAVSHAEGNSTIAIGDYSHSSGLGTITNNEAEFACGKYNKSEGLTIFSIGIGDDKNGRKNALTITMDGSVYAGDIDADLKIANHKDINNLQNQINTITGGSGGSNGGSITSSIETAFNNFSSENVSNTSDISAYIRPVTKSSENKLCVEPNGNLKQLLENINSISNSDISFNCDLHASAFYETSDERLKTFKNDIEIDLEKMLNIRKSYFTFNSSPNLSRIGVSAQEIEKVFPELVSKDSNGYLSVNYSKLSVIALSAIDKLYIKNVELEKRLARLEELINKE